MTHPSGRDRVLHPIEEVIAEGLIAVAIFVPEKS
jgi:hypothetical protein